MSGRSRLVPLLRSALGSTQCQRQQSRSYHGLLGQPVLRANRPVAVSYAFPRQLRAASAGPKRTVRGGALKLWRDSPFQFSLAVAIILIASGYLVFVNYFYHYIIIGAYHNYPEPVAKQLRKAVYYMKTDLRPDDALKYFKQALQTCEEEQMDPMSDEVMGIRIEVSRLMEIIHRYDKSVEVLERIRADNMRWLEVVGGREENIAKRTRVLSRTIAISVKLAELYTNGAIWKRDLAEERLVWAVETVYKERQRRLAQNVKDEDEGPWMSDDEIGATDERLAQTYAEQDQHYLAVPLYLQCLQLKSTTDCHSVTLMSNLATSLAQQSPRAAREAQAFAQSRNISTQSGSAVATGPMATRESFIEDAKQWAQKALSVARELQPPERDDECDVGCVVATHNLGEFAEMLGNNNEARERYEEAISLAKGIGFIEGVENSRTRLKKLAAS